MKYAVLQKEALGILYTNGLPNVSKALPLYLFADDTNVYYESVNIRKLKNKINKELLKFKSWLQINELALNCAKINFVVFHSHREELLNDIQFIIWQQAIGFS